MKIKLKIFLLIFVTSLLTFSFVIAYLINDYRQLSLEDARKQVSNYTSHAANLITTSLEKDLSVCATIAQGFRGSETMSVNLRDSIYNNVLKNVIESNPEYLSSWMTWELKFLDKNYMLDYGRRRTVAAKESGIIAFYIDTVEVAGDNLSGLYYKTKQSHLDILTNPYYYTFTKGNEQDSILETSVATPIIINDEFAGLVGLDITLDRFWDLIKNVQPFETSDIFLLDGEGTVISSSSSQISRHDSITKLYPELIKHNTIDNIQRGELFSLNFVDSTSTTFYASFAPISIGKAQTSWSVCLVTPTSTVEAGAKGFFVNWLIISLLGTLVLSVISYLIAYKLSVPIKRATSILTKMSKGIIDDSHKLKYQSNDEVAEMNASINKLMDALQTMADFAKQIGEGNFKTSHKALSKNDTLGNALINMQQNLKTSKEREEARKIESRKLNWAQTGLTEISEILRKSNIDFDEYLQSILSYLLKYLKSEQGAIFTLNNKDKEHPYLELSSAYAYDKHKALEYKLEIGESLVGRCFQEQEIIYLTNIPEGYTFVSSGLGEHQPRCLFLMPLIIEKEAFGVIEIASFKLFEDFEIDFLKVVGERIASSISIMEKNFQTQKVLQQFQAKSDELENLKTMLSNNNKDLELAYENANWKDMENKEWIKALSELASITWMDMDGTVIKVVDKRLTDAHYSDKNIMKFKTSVLQNLKKNYPDELGTIWENVKKGLSGILKSSYTIHNKEFTTTEFFMPFVNSKDRSTQVLNISVDHSKYS